MSLLVENFGNLESNLESIFGVNWWYSSNPTRCDYTFYFPRHISVDSCTEYFDRVSKIQNKKRYFLILQGVLRSCCTGITSRLLNHDDIVRDIDDRSCGVPSQNCHQFYVICWDKNDQYHLIYDCIFFCILFRNALHNLTKI